MPTALTSKSLRNILSKLHLYDRHEDLWAALKEGCFLSRQPILFQTKFLVRDWWEPEHQPRTLIDVIAEWDEACRLGASEEFTVPPGIDGKDILSILIQTQDGVEEELDRSKKYLEHVDEATEDIRELTETLQTVLDF
ncbi:hypothetical protein DFP72DRAFT_1068325 [Ephemerocybe angulata]|uniref:Uncharacterized protein n=1 Tax=Ephemerocybe angulata TaxID=980116 RepID=A0A8H6M7A5_9AGAR|nr:hypothetical protein DFP72DRAFT_1068325 [Tulosesus angulatus]